MAEKRKRLKWGRWLLLALVVLYFAPVIPLPWQVWGCGTGWQDDLYVGGDEETEPVCEPREGREWVSPSAIPATILMHQMVHTARLDGQSYEAYTEEAAERRTRQARRWLTLARISTFRPRSLNRRIQRERAFLMQHDGEYERASRRFEWLTQYSRYAFPGETYVEIDFFFARRNAFLAGDMDRVWTLTESGLEARHPTEFSQRAGWLLDSAYLAIEAGEFERAENYITHASVLAERVAPVDDRNRRLSSIHSARGALDLARYQTAPDPLLAESALGHFRQGADIGGYVLTHQSAIRALSYLGRCEEADELIDQSLEQIELAEPEFECFEPENGVRFMEWIRQVQRCRLMRLGNRDGAAEACAEVEAMAARGCTQAPWEPERDRMRLPESYPEPLACFASEDDPDQGGAGDQADRG